MATRKRDEDDETGPQRTCIVTRVAQPKEGMIRFVLSPDGVVTPDIRQNLPGRGVWVTGRRATVEEAVRKKIFGRALKAQAETPPELADEVDRFLERDALQALSLANKAGAVTAGFSKVESAIGAGKARALIQARDGGADGARKLGQVVRRAEVEGGRAVQLVDCFESTQLDLALGRTNVIHAALAGGGAAENFLARSRRLGFYRSAGQRDDDETGVAGSIPAAMKDTNGQGPGTENE